MNRVLILGGVGFLGVNLARFCADKGAEVYVVDSLDARCGTNQERLALLPKGTQFKRDTVLGIAHQPRFLNQFDAIFHCAGQSSHPQSISLPLYDLEHNCRHTLALLDGLAAIDYEGAVVYAGSSTVIGQAVEPIVDERHPERPRDIYSAHKGVAEKYHVIYRNVHGLQTVPLRLTNLYGPYGKSSPEFGFVNYFISLAARGEPITVWGPGNQTRNLLYVDDACNAMWIAAKTSQVLNDGAYFVSGDTHYSIMKVALAVAKAFGGTVNTLPWPEERWKIEIGHVKISSALFRLCTGWDPRYSLTSGLAKTKEVMDV